MSDKEKLLKMDVPKPIITGHVEFSEEKKKQIEKDFEKMLKVLNEKHSSK